MAAVVPATIVQSPVPAGGQTKTSPEQSAPVASAIEAPINCDELYRRCLGRIDFAERLLASFEKRFPIESAELLQTIDERDWPRAARLAHQLKGATANICAPGLRQIMQDVEQALNREPEGAEAWRSKIDAEWTRWSTYRQSLPQSAAEPSLG